MDLHQEFPANDLRFSIIIPLEFHRGQVDACLRIWAQQQVYARNQYEIVAVGCRHSLDEEICAFFKSLLGPSDQFLLFDEPHDVALCAHATTHARGEVLFFTESHCLPEPNTLSLADRALREHPEWAGFSCKSIRVTHNSLSIVEADMYDADIQYGMNEHPWRKILDQCFVVRAESYHNAGGFRADLGHFSEWHLSAQMHQMGYQIGYVPEIEIKHYYSGDIHELIEFTKDFAQGEMILHANLMDDTCYSYFTIPNEWRTRYQWLPLLAEKAFFLLGQSYLKPIWSLWNPSEFAVRFRVFLELAFRAHGGLKLEVALASVRFQLAYWGVRLGAWLRVDRATLLPLFLRLIYTVVCLQRIRFVTHWLAGVAGDEAQRHVAPAESLIWHPDIAQTFYAVGFHPLEIWQEQPFCWSEPVGMIEISLPAGKYCFSMEWLPVNHVKALMIYLDEKPIPMVRDESCKVSSLPFEVNSAHPVRFAWTCERWVAPGDSRLLGIAVSAISVVHQ